MDRFGVEQDVCGMLGSRWREYGSAAASTLPVSEEAGTPTVTKPRPAYKGRSLRLVIGMRRQIRRTGAQIREF